MSVHAGKVLYEDDQLSIRSGDRVHGYQVDRVAGVGTFCVVFHTHEGAALKIAREEYTSAEDIRAIDTEERILAHLNASYPGAPIIQHHENFRHEGRRCMAMERAEGSLWDYMNRDWGKLKRVFFSLAVGLAVLEDAGVIHADLKPCNVLMVNGQPRLADFNCSKWHESSGRYYGDIGTMRYMAPETLLCGVLHPASDVWSFGCILASVLLGDDVFPKDTHADVTGGIVDLLGAPPVNCRLRSPFMRLCRHDARAHGSGCTWTLAELVQGSVVDIADAYDLLDLLHAVLKWDHHERPSPQEILSHPLFAGMHTDVSFVAEAQGPRCTEIKESRELSWEDHSRNTVKGAGQGSSSETETQSTNSGANSDSTSETDWGNNSQVGPGEMGWSDTSEPWWGKQWDIMATPSESEMEEGVHQARENIHGKGKDGGRGVGHIKDSFASKDKDDCKNMIPGICWEEQGKEKARSPTFRASKSGSSVQGAEADEGNNGERTSERNTIIPSACMGDSLQDIWYSLWFGA